MNDSERAKRQQEMVERIWRVGEDEIEQARRVLDAQGSYQISDLSHGALWAVLRLACERSDVWDALAQVRQVVLLTSATERAELADPVGTRIRAAKPEVPDPCMFCSGVCDGHSHTVEVHDDGRVVFDNDPNERLAARCRDVAAAIANGDDDVAEALYNAITEARDP